MIIKVDTHFPDTSSFSLDVSCHSPSLFTMIPKLYFTYFITQIFSLAQTAAVV